MVLARDDQRDALGLMRSVAMFTRCSTESLSQLAGSMTTHTYARNDVIVTQDQPAAEFHLVAAGDVSRFHTDGDGVEHHIDQGKFSTTINSLQVLGHDAAYASARCVADSCKTYALARNDFLAHLAKSPPLAQEIISGLSRELGEQTKRKRTPLLAQQSRELNVPAVTIAATIESYYRSALNAMLNQRLTGMRAELFPNMHIQVPTRILYINGFKIMRSAIEKNVNPEEYAHPGLVQLASAIAPGILMTPISSVLEATNAGHQNPEPMARRWMRGVMPRAAREVIFGIGLNQMSDFFEERMSPWVSNPLVANAAGSLAAGVVSGYLSHVPHNMSTFKLLYPHKSYGELYAMFVEKSAPAELIPKGAPPGVQQAAKAVFATLFPRGVGIRTIQIVGSFMILNGTINAIQAYDGKRIRRALELADYR